jgi:hypothetical protein
MKGAWMTCIKKLVATHLLITLVACLLLQWQDQLGSTLTLHESLQANMPFLSSATLII